MKKLWILFGFIVFAALVWGQPKPHSVSLTWEDPDNPAGMLYSVYRGDARCAQSPVFVRIAQDVVPKSYVDGAVSVGNYCYVVRVVSGLLESVDSNQALAEVRPWPVVKVDVSVK